MTNQQTPLRWPLPPSPSLYHPSAQLTRLRQERPVAPVTMPDGSTGWLVTRHADVRTVLTDARFSRALATRAQPGEEIGTLTAESLIGMDPPQHTRLRRLVSRAFSPRRIERLRPWVAEVVDGLVDDLVARGRPADLVEHFSLPLPVLVISELFGLPPADRPRCKAWSDALMSGHNAPDAAREAMIGFARVIDGKRTNPGDDLITALIAARDERGALTGHELLSMSVGLLVGGHESTTQLINLSLLTLLRHPDQLARLRADLDLLPQAVEELLRFVQIGDTGVLPPRVATEDVELGGATVPAGATVLCAFITANRDPAVFTDPDRLDLTRSPNPHLGLGVGLHNCIGGALARLELQQALRGLLSRLPGVRLAVAESDLRFTPGLAVRSLVDLPVSW